MASAGDRYLLQGFSENKYNCSVGEISRLLLCTYVPLEVVRGLHESESFSIADAFARVSFAGTLHAFHGSIPLLRTFMFYRRVRATKAAEWLGKAGRRQASCGARLDVHHDVSQQQQGNPSTNIGC